MSYDHQSRDGTGRQRENLMQQRLRKSRGEEVDETFDYRHDDDDGVPRTFSRPSSPLSFVRGVRNSCTSTLFLIALGAILALLAVGFLFNQTGGGLGNLFAGVPNLATIVVTPTPVVQNGTAVVRRIQQLSRLETASYTVEQVIEVRQDSSVPLIGNILASDALLLIAHGKVVAGVDLSQLDADSVTISSDGRSITLRLPPVQILDFGLDSSKTRVYSRDRGVFAPENKDLETRARQEAEQRILQAACEDGVMSRATEAAEVSLQKFLSLLDYDDVVVVPSAPAACVAPGASSAATPAP
ncbi:MAG: DUF4230 domain-containing protein [Oscillochloris sp.]|nr:DUF4230 domain-containing protein [Oscillochloris sp.]